MSSDVDAMRALRAALRPFAHEDTTRSAALFGQALAMHALCLALAVGASAWPLRLVLSVAAGLVQLRLFIFFHDAMHGAIFRGSPLGRALATLVGAYMLVVPSVWRETHDGHHASNGRIEASAIGGFPLPTRDAWRRATPGERRAMRLSRHPLTIACGYLTIFAIGMNLAPFVRDPRRHAWAPGALALHVGLLVLAWHLGGPSAALLGIALPHAIALGIGSYLIYAQHNFPDARLPARRDLARAALDASSAFDMPPLLHWLTGNIGLHHVHHLDHRVPFYRLPEASRAIARWARPGRTSFRPADVIACLRIAAWDAERARMVTYAELDGTPPA